MSDPKDKVKENVAGAYYVDSSCIDCDVCRDTAPDNFMRSDETAIPLSTSNRRTRKSEQLCDEAISCCPVEAIGKDGES